MAACDDLAFHQHGSSEAELWHVIDEAGGRGVEVGRFAWLLSCRGLEPTNSHSARLLGCLAGCRLACSYHSPLLVGFMVLPCLARRFRRADSPAPSSALVFRPPR